MQKKGSNYLIYSKLHDSPFTTLAAGKNKIFKNDVRAILADAPNPAVDKVKEDHLFDINIEPVADQITVKNFCSLPITLRVCSFTKPRSVSRHSFYKFSKITQLTISIADVLELNIKRAPEAPRTRGRTRDKAKGRRRLRKLIDTVERNLQAWGNIDEGNVVCCICLKELKDNVGRLDCGHMFCPECIECWSEQATYCPLCKKEFKRIRKECAGVLIDEVPVHEKKLPSENESDSDDVCYECNYGGDDDKLLICDECDMNCCHTYCDGLDAVPENSWLCKFCRREFEDLLAQDAAEKEKEKTGPVPME